MKTIERLSFKKGSSMRFLPITAALAIVFLATPAPALAMGVSEAVGILEAVMSTTGKCKTSVMIYGRSGMAQDDCKSLKTLIEKAKKAVKYLATAYEDTSPAQRAKVEYFSRQITEDMSAINTLLEASQ